MLSSATQHATPLELGWKVNGSALTLGSQWLPYCVRDITQSYIIMFNNNLISTKCLRFLIYFAYSRIGRGNLVLRHFITHFSLHFWDIACCYSYSSWTLFIIYFFTQLQFLITLSNDLALKLSKLTKRPAAAQRSKCVSVNATDCGFDSHSTKLLFFNILISAIFFLIWFFWLFTPPYLT